MSLTNKKKSFLARWFGPRDLMIRERDKISFCSLSSKQQEALFVCLLALAGWSVFTSVYFLRYNKMIAEKSEQLRQIQTDYADLQGEVMALIGHMDKLVSETDEDEADSEKQSELRKKEPEIGKVDATADVPEATVAGKKDGREDKNTDFRMENEAAFVRERMLHALDKRATSKSEQDRLTFHKMLLQRDIAVAEAEALQKKVGNLEDLISGMQEAQILAFRKMAALADDNVNNIESDLSDIKQSLARNGVSMERLLHRIRRDKEVVGIGGPFIPTPMPKPQHDLNISLVRLNQRLDRWYDLTTLQNSLPIGKPVDRIRVTSSFGSRGDPFQGGPAHHEAVDLGGMIGEPVYATAPGKVVRTGNWGWYGNMVEIDHGLGFRTRYAHMEKVFVTKGETVRAGDRIGTLGNTGRSTGPHLHYEVRIRGMAVDPMNFIKAKKYVFKD